jgi:hypothetical protein
MLTGPASSKVAQHDYYYCACAIIATYVKLSMDANATGYRLQLMDGSMGNHWLAYCSVS